MTRGIKRLGEPVAGIVVGDFGVDLWVVLVPLSAIPFEIDVGDKFRPTIMVGVGETFVCPPKFLTLFPILNRPVTIAKKTITTMRPRTNETILLKLSTDIYYHYRILIATVGSLRLTFFSKYRRINSWIIPKLYFLGRRRLGLIKKDPILC